MTLNRVLLQQHWWKVVGALLLIYTLIAGFLMPVPALAILHETIRNLYFHVPMWFGMFLLFFIAVIYSIHYLRTSSPTSDIISLEMIRVGLLFGILGMVTGMEWAHFTWGTWWSHDPKQNAAAVGLLIYFAYFVLRHSFDEVQQRARIANVYSIFAFALLVPLIFILPRFTDSLHPGSGGNPGFNVYDLDGRMRAVFYPAVLGWTLIGAWLANLRIRTHLLHHKRKLKDATSFL